LILLARSIFEFWMWLPHDFWMGLMYRAGGAGAILDSITFYSYVFFADYSIQEPLSFWSGLFVEPFLGLIIGLIAWRMLICGKYIGLLGKEFELTPMFQHPDNCEGLEPLGNLSLLNALIISIWGIFLGGWIIIGPSAKSGFYVPMYQALLIVPIGMALACFILPLLSIHKKMKEKGLELKDKLDRLAYKIRLLEQEKLNFAGNLNPENIDKFKDLDYIKDVYKSNLRFSTWPFNYKILLAFISSQAVPILGLTGLGAPTIGVISSIISFITKLGGTH
jgi:hypothetical protein